jgi:hypothetical protein
MGKLETFDKKRTQWEGLWWHPECNAFYSKTFSLASIKKFKGTVRLFVRKNRYFNNGENGRPNYQFSIQDSKGATVAEFEVEDIEDREEERTYTYEEVQDIINKVACDIGGDGLYGEYLVSDYI